MPPPRCCICRTSAQKHTYPTAGKERLIRECFEIEFPSPDHPSSSRLCSTCQGMVTNYEKKGIRRPDRVNRKGVVGQHGHKTVGGKRTSIPRPPPAPATVSKLTSETGIGTDLTGEDIKVTKRRLDLLTDVSDQQPLNRSQEILYHKMTTSYLDQAAGMHCKNFKTRPTHGPGINLFAAPKTRVSSSTCSNQTRRNRSETIEEFHAQMSCRDSSTDEEREQSRQAQRVSMFTRNKEEYLNAMKAAGFKVLCKFSRETVMDLRSRMPMTSWQYIKRTLKNELGIDLMGSNNLLREEISSLEYEYECVSFKDADTGKEIHAIRVANVADVITRTVQRLKESGQLQDVSNCDLKTLWVHISGDKGGKSTKLMLQIINASNRHSIKSAKILGMFEGGKDTRSNIAMAFTPIFDQLKQLKVNFTLDLDRPAAAADSDSAPGISSSQEGHNQMDTLWEIDQSNQTISKDCAHCSTAESTCTADGEESSDSSAHNESECLGSEGNRKYQHLRLTYGGDWEWLARLLGLSGPNGKHFCLHCLALKSELSTAKGMSYGLHELGNGANDWNEAGDNASGSCILRTYEGCIASNTNYVSDGAREKDILSYNNCKHVPLNSEEGTIIDSISTTPLHVSLGVGLDNINIIEKMAVDLDCKVKEADGETTANMTALMDDRNALLREIQDLTDHETDLQQQVADIEEQELQVKNDNPRHFEKANRIFVDKSREAVASRSQVKALGREKTVILKASKDNEALKSTKETELKTALEKIAKESGPFKELFDQTMDELKLKRVVYHSGALIGPDVHKTVQPESIAKFGNIFRPVELTTKNGKQTFGSDELAEKVVDLLSKFAACYRLYTKNAALCKHEVEQLCLNCAEFGAWFPTNFPNHSIKPKFHMLVVEMPRQVRRLQTIGMMTEQVSESIHPYVNKLERMFASTRDVAYRQRLIMRQHNMMSGKRDPVYQKVP